MTVAAVPAPAAPTPVPTGCDPVSPEIGSRFASVCLSGFTVLLVIVIYPLNNSLDLFGKDRRREAPPILTYLALPEFLDEE
jgi:hypothetical protein